jgi:predicted O-methyltransferase YrrM
LSTGRLKRLLKAPAEALLRAFARAAAPAFAVVARRGIGTEHCLARGFLPVPLHYYQPVFDPATIPETVWTRKHDLPGIRYDPDGQLALLDELGRFGPECSWPEHATSGYYAQNGSFGYSSGALLHSMVRHLAPERVIEVGAGMSTLIIADALERNGRGVLTTIDPNPREQVADLLERREVISEYVERLPLGTFDALRAGDLLFIDSSHVVRTGGDVNHLYLDVLPRLAPGVVVHIHDIQLPYEYSRSYSERTHGARTFWTEQYLLQAFLTQNPSWEVLLAGHHLQRDFADRFQSAFPNWRPDAHRATTSFYIRAS